MFSLVGQSYRPLTIHLVTQRFTAAELAALRSALAPMAQIEDGPTIAYLKLGAERTGGRPIDTVQPGYSGGSRALSGLPGL